jgi:hypothetical protein
MNRAQCYSCTLLHTFRALCTIRRRYIAISVVFTTSAVVEVFLVLGRVHNICCNGSVPGSKPTNFNYNSAEV